MKTTSLLLLATFSIALHAKKSLETIKPIRDGLIKADIHRVNLSDINLSEIKNKITQVEPTQVGNMVGYIAYGAEDGHKTELVLILFNPDTDRYPIRIGGSLEGTFVNPEMSLLEKQKARNLYDFLAEFNN